MFKRVLVANRGEIAVRIIRTCKFLGIETVAVYSDADTEALHVRMADKAVRLGSANPGDSYLNIEKIVQAAIDTDSDAVHPGYGFVSENWNLAARCQESGIRFVGPSPKTLALAANKVDCKIIAQKAGVPVIEGSDHVIDDPEEAKTFARALGYPVLVKSAFGGGGRGIRLASSDSELVEAVDIASFEIRHAFGKVGIFIEKVVRPARHIEVQFVSYGGGRTIHFGERECSIQRRHQKLLEMSPSPGVDEEARKRIGGYAVSLANALEYENVGTAEFLMDGRGGFHFIEVNSRLQVEHPVTEVISGVDLVEEQLLIAEGVATAPKQNDVVQNGAAIQCRINAEDPTASFAPSGGKIEYLFLPSGEGVRIDTALYPGYEVPEYYDSLLAKVITNGKTLEEARRRMAVALSELRIDGVRTTLPLQQFLIQDERFKNWDLDVSFMEQNTIVDRLTEKCSRDRDALNEEAAIIAAALLASGARPALKRRAAQGEKTKVTHRGSRFYDAV